MEISLEKIELVKDRTGVSYKEAKDALIKANGSVVDAIIMIEDEIDVAPKSAAANQASILVDKVKEAVHKGNVSRILVKKDDETILNIPVTFGILGLVCVPWVTIVSTVAALGLKCSIELVKVNGEVVNISEKASETFSGVKDGASVIADDLKERSGDAGVQMKGAFETIKEKASVVVNKVKNDEVSIDDFDDDYFNFDDFDDSILDDLASDADMYKAATEDDEPSAHADIEEPSAEAVEAVAEAVEEAEEEAAEAAPEAEDAVETVVEAAPEADEAAPADFEVEITAGEMPDMDAIETVEEAVEAVEAEAEDAVETAIDDIDDLIIDFSDVDEAPAAAVRMPSEEITSMADSVAEEIAKAAADAAGKAAPAAEQPVADALDDIDKAGEKFEAAINDYKQKKNRFFIF